jgi:ParB/RepB/Spo0J family partition protein
MAKQQSLGARVRARRAELGDFSIDEVVKRAGDRGFQLSAGAVSQIETGKNENPQLDRLRGLAAALDWSLSELLDGGPASAVRMIPLSELYDDPDNPREIAPAEVEQDGLIDSVRQLGIILALAVRQVKHEDGRTVWAVVDGHRRLMAARAVFGPKAKTLIPCRAVVADDSKALLMALSANLQRADMNPIDIAKAVGSLVEHKVPTKEIAASTGYKIRWVQNMAAIHLHLSERGKEFLRAGQIGISQATALASQRNKTVQDELLARTLGEGWNEDRIREEIKGGKPQQKALGLEPTVDPKGGGANHRRCCSGGRPQGCCHEGRRTAPAAFRAKRHRYHAEHAGKQRRAL